MYVMGAHMIIMNMLEVIKVIVELLCTLMFFFVFQLTEIRCITAAIFIVFICVKAVSV